jgi:hypothetical protein
MITYSLDLGCLFENETTILLFPAQKPVAENTEVIANMMRKN